MKPRIATIILNRNMPESTDALVEFLQQRNNGETDIYVVESGSDRERLSRHYSFWANWEEATREGLRWPRGFNYGLAELLKAGKFFSYDYFFLVCNDTIFLDNPIPPLMDEMDAHPRVGILSPCAENWQERSLIGESGTAYVWHINHVAWMVRRSFVETVMEREQPGPLSFLYDGTNFRGYGADLELIVKGYINEHATALTTKALIRENTDILRYKADLMRTDSFTVNQRRVFEEGQDWMRRKYGFTTWVHMHTYASMFYDRFFHLYPQYRRHRLPSVTDRIMTALELQEAELC